MFNCYLCNWLLLLLDGLLMCSHVLQLGYCTCIRSGDKAEERGQDIVTQADLENLLHLLESKGGVMDWQCFMERSTPNMQYQAWRHDPEVDSVVQLSLHADIVYNLTKSYLCLIIMVNLNFLSIRGTGLKWIYVIVVAIPYFTSKKNYYISHHLC